MAGVYLHPGLYVEEKPSGPAPVQAANGVLTLALAGWTKKGPDHVATYVSSWLQFEKDFGGFTADSKMPTGLYAYFANGGSAAYIVRTTPSDAVKASAYIFNNEVTASIGTGNASATAFTGTLSGSPGVVPGSFRVVCASPASSGVDNGSGSITGTNIAAGSTINYTTGAYVINFTTAPANSQAITATYDEALWRLNLKWPGDDGNNYRVRLEGNPATLVTGQGGFSLWNVMFDYTADNGVTWSEIERFEAVSMTSPTHARYFPNVINASIGGSKIFDVALPSFDDEVPGVLMGTQILNENVGTGDNTATTFTDTLLSTPVVPFSVRIDYTDSTAKVITDDGFGNLIGDVDPTGVNTINYTTGAISYKASGAPDVGAILCDYYATPASASFTSRATGGTDGSAITSADVTSASLEATNKGIFAFKAVSDVLTLALPDFAGDKTVLGALIDFADRFSDRFVLPDPPESLTPSDMKLWKQSSLAKTSSNAAVYYPWVQIKDPVTRLVTAFPPSCHVAGIIARTDQRKNVGKAPAGREDGQLRYIVGLERELLDTEVDILYPVGINPILRRPQIGTAVWGSRTLDSLGEFNQVNARRLFHFLGKSLFNSLHWVNFENNGPNLWTRVRFQIDAFMTNLHNNGYFAGTTKAQSFFVQVDAANNPPEVVDAGQLVIDVGFAPNKPAEFVVIRLQKMLSTS